MEPFNPVTATGIAILAVLMTIGMIVLPIWPMIVLGAAVWFICGAWFTMAAEHRFYLELLQDMREGASMERQYRALLRHLRRTEGMYP